MVNNTMELIAGNSDFLNEGISETSLHNNSTVLKSDKGQSVGIFEDRLIWKFKQHPKGNIHNHFLRKKLVMKHQRAEMFYSDFEGSCCKPYGIWASESGYYLLLEYLKFKNIGSLKANGSLNDPEQMKNMVTAVASLLGSIHQKGYSHGDIKWANILYDQEKQTPYLIDLDSVKKVSSVSAKACRMDVARFVRDAARLGASDEPISIFIDCYASKTGQSYETVVRSIQAPLSKLTERHYIKIKP
ncbi:lipopolysaccharide kinase InaA family protein [Neptuniibacter sp.]|uniref:protein kinase domain-containing protein n=1 Tax=Neptuniibacter sp. TaxID=1962643 RepID=UPI002635E18C|nr:lipopolysaccharide kinase InaA family protein [Neptuniibacter sp.]